MHSVSLPKTQTEYPLIAADEPPPVEILNRDGTARVVLTGDHASNRVPRALSQLGLADDIMQRHVAYDIGTRKLLRHLSQHLDAPAVLAGYSRLVVDLNRSLEDSTLMPAVSDGIVVPANQAISEQERAERIQSFFTPYRAAIDAMLQSYRTQDQVPALISIHSFTPQMAGVHRPWHVGVLWDTDSRIPVPLMEKLRAHPERFNVGDNEPYSGKHPADYTIDHHAEAAGLPHVSIEIRQDLVNDEAGAERWASILHEALREVLSQPSLYSLWTG